MTDITVGELNQVPIGTEIEGTSLAQNVIGYVFGVGTPIPTINGIEAIGGPGGPALSEGPGVTAAGAGVIGWGRKRRSQ